MKINWFEVIAGIIVLFIPIFFSIVLRDNNLIEGISPMFYILGGYHMGKGLYENNNKEK